MIRKRNRLTISIHASAHDLFTFLLDPANTPRWIENITEEQADSRPPKEGTAYRIKDTEGVWHEYVITHYDPDTSFIMKMHDGNYHVRYTLIPREDGTTELEYYEWVIRGNLADPFAQSDLEKLKSVIENNSRL